MQVPRGYVTRALRHPANVFMTETPPPQRIHSVRPNLLTIALRLPPNDPSRRPLPTKELHGVTHPNLGHPTNDHGQRASPPRRKRATTEVETPDQPPKDKRHSHE